MGLLIPSKRVFRVTLEKTVEIKGFTSVWIRTWLVVVPLLNGNLVTKGCPLQKRRTEINGAWTI